MRFLCLSILIAILFAGPAEAQTSTKDFLQKCREDAGYCDGYLTGVVETAIKTACTNFDLMPDIDTEDLLSAIRTDTLRSPDIVKEILKKIGCSVH